MGNNTTKKRRSKRGLGRLYKRGKDGKEYPADSKVQGTFYLECRVNGKRTRQRLTDDVGKPITTIRAAQEEQQRLAAPFVASRKSEQLQAVKAKLEAAEGHYQAAYEDANPPLAIVDAWDAYLDSSERNDSGEVTLGNYKTHWTKLTEWLAEKHPDLAFLRDLTPTIASDFMKTRNSSPNTYNKTLTFMKSFFEVLKEPGRIEANPFVKIKRKRAKTESRRPLTVEELQTVLTEAAGDLEVLLALGTFTGLRLGDCCTLKWGDVDFAAGVIRRIPNKTRSRQTTPKPVVVGISPMLASLLNETPQKSRRGYVLPTVADQYLKDETAITKSIQAHFEACGIKTHREGTGKGTGKRAVVEVGFHSLRHTYVTLHAERGTPQAVVQAIVGHSNPQMTQSYTHISEGVARRLSGVINLDSDKKSHKEPLPTWAVEILKGMTARNWKAIKRELLQHPVI